MEELIKMVTQKAGISESQAKSAVDTVVSFLKDKMPGGLGKQVESFVTGNTSSVGNVVDGIKEKMGL
jgi:nucleoid DNA-binding protein